MPSEEDCRSLGAAVAGGLNIRIYCRVCAHNRIVLAEPLSALFRIHRWADDLPSVKAKLRCRCGAKSSAIHATRETPNGAPIGPTTGAEYKALVKRLRD
jgi:hypothetical protein